MMGKGNGGGGGGTGIVDYPAHMKTWHTAALGDGSVITSDISDIMEAALGSSPFAAASAYNPDADITAYEAAISGFSALLTGITETTDWAALYTQATTSITISDKAVTGITDAEIVIDSAAFGDSLDDQITTTVLPRFQSGMRDINSVVSSAFVIGESNIEGFRDRDVAKHESGLRVVAQLKNADVDLDVAKMNLSKDIGVEQTRASAADSMLKFLIQKYSWEDGYMRTVIEGKRIKIVAKKEENAEDIGIDEADAKWDLEVFQYGANLLASIGSGVASPKDGGGPSQLQTAIGGAMSGAATGALIGSVVPGLGTGAGAGIGAALGFAAAFL